MDASEVARSPAPGQRAAKLDATFDFFEVLRRVAAGPKIKRIVSLGFGHCTSPSAVVNYTSEPGVFSGLGPTRVRRRHPLHPLGARLSVLNILTVHFATLALTNKRSGEA